MFHLKSPKPNNFDQALSFLEQNPALSDSLLAECNHDVEKVTTIIQPILNAALRCEIARFYIQAITTGRTTFLVTNLKESEALQITDSAASWLLGRSGNCAIAIKDTCISRQHAVIGHVLGREFYITDVGSSNGTWVNHRRLAHLERCLLRDGDLIQLGPVQIEFFIANSQIWSPAAFDVGVTEFC
ncbi:FHA domain-containing protein [Microseira wollei]|uniref:FHA domain protein n=1 Tax=Microseira wollei NIES-4236 TaxID=2530354 RepID=A0AAV3XI46_9CYAN|nr:FHA domain-containing protein [Microseira wollei]GET39805.1 FHA domain protein [Microseira wollei NIES-4236]